MIRKTLFFSLSILMLASCTNKEYKEGMTITKFQDGTIFTADGSEVPVRPEGWEDATAILLARHTEATTDEENPGLSDAGLAMADKLAAIAQPLGIEEVFMTEKRRVIFTARPLAMEYNIPVSTYSPEQYDRVTEKIFSKRNGKNVMIYGHSNTTPELINLIAGTNLETIPHEQYNNLYIVLSKCIDAESVVYKFKY